MTEAPKKLEFSQVKLPSPKGGHFSVAYASLSKPVIGQTGLIIAHGAGGPMYSPFITYFHKGLAEKGYLTVKFNFPYMEARRKIPDKRETLEASYKQVIEKTKTSDYHPSRLFVGGKSMGGRIASQVVADGEEVDGLFFLGYPLHPPGRPEAMRDQHLYRIQKPMLFISGTHDSFAKKELLEPVLEKLGDRAQIHWVEGGDHGFNTHQGKEAQAKIYEDAIDTLDKWFRAHGG